MTTDYYALLEISRTAEVEEIRAAIRGQRRLWVRRQSSPDPERRTEAERRIRDLDQAEKTLLDAQARTAYDRSLDKPPVSSEQHSPRARETSAAREGQRLDRASLDRARTLLAQGRAAAAGHAAREVVEADPADPDARLCLGEAYLDQRKWRQAITELEQALAHRPGDVAARIGIGTAYLHTERIAEGVALLRAVREEHPDDESATQAYATGLYEQAVDGLAEVYDGKVALSARQVARVRRNLRGISRLQIADPQVEGKVAHLKGVLDEARQRVKVPSGNRRFYAASFGCALLLLAFAPAVAFQVTAVVLGAGTGWLYVRRHRPQAWRVRRREYARRVTKRGI